MTDVTVKVVGLKSLLQSTKAIGGDLAKGVTKSLRDQLTPTVNDARSRFRGLPGTGPRTAPSVRGFVRQNGIGFQMGGKGGDGHGFELGREFGAKNRTRVSTFERTAGGGSPNAGSTFRVTRFENYSQPTLFGPWTGNQFRPELHALGGVSGRAFYPAIAAAYDRIADNITRIVDAGLTGILKEGE